LFFQAAAEAEHQATKKQVNELQQLYNKQGDKGTRLLQELHGLQEKMKVRNSVTWWFEVHVEQLHRQYLPTVLPVLCWHASTTACSWSSGWLLTRNRISQMLLLLLATQACEKEEAEYQANMEKLKGMEDLLRKVEEEEAAAVERAQRLEEAKQRAEEAERARKVTKERVDKAELTITNLKQQMEHEQKAADAKELEMSAIQEVRKGLLYWVWCC
jgi:hypothetical protein